MSDERRAETERLEALHGYRLLDSGSDPAFDAIVREAATALGAPISLISLVDERRQWFKAKVGLAVDETPRSMSFCAHAIAGSGPMVVPDATRDARFRDNPLVVGDPAIRFYAGAVLRARNGRALGTLCVIDRVPRDGLSDEQLERLEALAERVMELVEGRRIAADD